MVTPQEQQEIDTTDVEKNKVMAVLAYILFLIPLLAVRDSKYTMFHTNQGLLLFLLAVAINVLGSILPVIGWFLIIPLGNLAVVILALIGIINAIKGRTKELPVIGKFNIIK